jgi:NADPH:quinone reductase
VTVDAADVFTKPAALNFSEAANLLLVGTTAAEMLHLAGVAKDDVVLLNGASGAVGTSALQQARLIGARVIGTASAVNFEAVRRYGGIPVQYGEGLEERVRDAAREGVTVALDTTGTDEAIDVSLSIVPDRHRIVSTAAFHRADDGIQLIGASNPLSAPYRASQRVRLLELAGAGQIQVPIGANYPLKEARAAVSALMSRHPYGKLALVA